MWIHINFEKNELYQTLSFVVENKDGGFIGTGPLYIVEAILEAQNRDLEPVFPNPTPTWPTDHSFDSNIVQVVELAAAVAIIIGIAIGGALGFFS
jgi:hypothetical protein